MNENLTKKELAVVERTIEKAQKLTLTTYKAVLSQNPPKSIIKHHDFGNFDYLPITAVERLLDGLFESWYFDIKREAQVANGFYVVGTLHAKLPQTDKELVADGIGFAEFQTTKGSLPTDLSKIIVGAGVMAIPRAKTEAIKNAAKQFGNLFGRNLTRKDFNAEAEKTVVYTSRNKIANTLEAVNE